MGSTDRLKQLVREAVGDERMVTASPLHGLGGVIINAPESQQALLWIRGPAQDERPALIQTLVPFDGRSVEAMPKVVEDAVAWMEQQRGQWTPAALADT